MAKEELFSNKIFAKLITALGTFPIKRDSVDVAAIKDAIRRLKKHAALVMFPEGTRHRDNELPALPGIGFLAEKSGVVVVPAYIEGADKALGADAKFIRLHKVSVRFGKPLTIDKHVSYKEFSRRVMNTIRRLKPPDKIDYPLENDC